MCTLFTGKGGDSGFAKFTVPTLKAFWKACGQGVSGNKRELVARAESRKTHFFSQSSGQLGNNAKTLFFLLHPLSLFPCNSCKGNSNGIFTASQF